MRVNERIMIDGEPITNESLVANWQDIQPYVAMVDAELDAASEPRLTFFEAFTALAFASFADAPVDVAVIEVGMGGEWDSTNVGDGQVAVFTPIALDHTKRLGSTVAEIARTKAGHHQAGSIRCLRLPDRRMPWPSLHARRSSPNPRWPLRARPSRC